MDNDLISFEAMLAAKESAEWAFWGVVIAAGSLFVTLLTFYVAVRALNSWKSQEIVKERKAFIVSVMKFQNIIGFGSNFNIKVLGNEAREPFWKLTNSLMDIYESSITMISNKDREQASKIYLELDDVYKQIHGGEIDNQTAINRIMEIRRGNFFRKF